MVLDIITINNDPAGVLSKKCEEVPIDEIKNYFDLAHDMIDTAKNIGALGLAANQVGISLRLFVLTDGAMLMFNPVVVARASTVTSYEEGCLSVPGKRFNIRRSKVIVVRGLDLDGSQFTLRPKKKLISFAIQHELDHLNGLTLQDLGKEVT